MDRLKLYPGLKSGATISTEPTALQALNELCGDDWTFIHGMNFSDKATRY